MRTAIAIAMAKAAAVPRCDGCRFWELQRPTAHADDCVGRCHRYAPAPAPGGFQYEVLEWLYAEHDIHRDPGCPEDAEALWPVTLGSDWCGEFVRRGKERAT